VSTQSTRNYVRK